MTTDTSRILTTDETIEVTRKLNADRVRVCLSDATKARGAWIFVGHVGGEEVEVTAERKGGFVWRTTK